MASIKQLSAHKYKITVSNGYRPDGRKISKAKTITVPDSIQRRGISQYVAHAAEEFEREVKNGYSEDAEMTFEEYALRWLARQTKYAPSTLASYRWRLAQEAAKHRRDLSPYLFVNEQGQLLHPDTFTKRLRKIYNAIGFPKEYHLHTLRHFFVSTLLHSGIDKQTVADVQIQRQKERKKYCG